MKEMMGYVTNRKTYLENLCECYGEPEGVADHLKALAKKFPLFSKMFQRDIADLPRKPTVRMNGRISAS